MSKAKAYSYIRMSTEVQLKGDSLRRQKEASASYAASNDLQLVEDFRLEDIGKSAFSGQHISQGAFGSFLKKIESGEIDKGSYLLVESLDRLSREAIESAALQFLSILKAGVNIVTLSDNHVYLAGQTQFTDIMYSIVVMARAHEESKTKSLRVGAAWENKRAKASEKKLTKVAPIWLELSEDRKSFKLIESKVAIVRKIFDEADAGKGSCQIARAMNLAGGEPIGKSNGWHESFITKILTSRAVLGEFQPHRYVGRKRVPHGDPVKAYYPAIISAEQFERVQYGRKTRRTRGAGRKGLNYRNLFSGIARCGYCNSRIMFIDKGEGPKGGLYLRCDSARRGNECTASNWHLKHFEAAFFNFVKELDLHSLLTDDAIGAERKRLDDQAAALQSQRSGLIVARDRAFELLASPDAPLEYVNSKLAELTKQIGEIDQKLAVIATQASELLARSQASELELALLVENVQNFSDLDTRSKIANWLRLNVRELLLFPDGVTDGAKERTLSVLFENDVFRTVSVDPNDPRKHSLSIYADRDRWHEER